MNPVHAVAHLIQHLPADSAQLILDSDSQLAAALI